MSNNEPVCSGWCAVCGREHRLAAGRAKQLALDLMNELRETHRIDYQTPATHADPRFSTDYLYGEARGQMFGVLECVDADGVTQVLRAFSCQYNGCWEVPGWVPPLFDVPAYAAVMDPADRQIKALGRQMEQLVVGSAAHHRLKMKRRQLSQQIMKELHALYQVRSFRGGVRPLASFFAGKTGIPTGAGDCCAPKLLTAALRRQWRPVGLAEFFWGRDNRSGTRREGEFYASCRDKCYPILGFMLCGVSG